MNTSKKNVKRRLVLEMIKYGEVDNLKKHHPRCDGKNLAHIQNSCYLAGKPYRELLVHPKGKTDTNNITGCVYKIPCYNRKTVSIGETGRLYVWYEKGRTLG